MTTVKPAPGGVPLVTLDKRTPVVPGFVLQLSDTLTPTRSTNCLRARVVPGLQTLDAYDLVLAYDLSGKLVLVVSASLGNVETRLYSVLLSFVEALRIAAGLPIAGADQRFQTRIEPDHTGDTCQGLHPFFYQDGEDIAFCLLFGDGHPPWLVSIGQETMHLEGGVFCLFEQNQSPGRVLVVQALPLLVICIGAFAHRPVRDVAATPEGTGKSLLLFVGWVKPIHS